MFKRRRAALNGPGEARVAISGTRPTPAGPRALVRIVVQRRAEGHATAEGSDELREPEASSDHVYFVRHTPGWGEGQPFAPDSEAFATLAGAMAAAEQSLPGPIDWDDEEHLQTSWDD